MARLCQQCGEKLSMLSWTTGRTVCKKCQHAGEERVKQARSTYQNLIPRLLASGNPPARIRSKLAPVATAAQFTEVERNDVHLGALRAFIGQLLAHDHLTDAEETRIDDAMKALGVNSKSVSRDLPDLAPRILVASLNAGRLAVLPNPPIILKKDEAAYLVVKADMMKHTVTREWQGAYGGVSFRLAKGVRVSTGSVRGRSVVVGARTEVADSGRLTVTSLRTVYAGVRQSIEMPHAKLLSLDFFDDGVIFNLSNRKNAVMFKLPKGWGSVVTATINAVFQRGI